MSGKNEVKQSKIVSVRFDMEDYADLLRMCSNGSCSPSDLVKLALDEIRPKFDTDRGLRVKKKPVVEDDEDEIEFDDEEENEEGDDE